MIEFAITMIIVLILLVAVADFARAFYTYISLRDAAQEGAVYGSMCPSNIDRIEDHVRFSSNFPVDLTDETHVQVICTFLNTGSACGSETPVPGTGIRVVVNYDNFELTTPLLGSFLGGQTLDLSATVEDIILRNEDEGAFQECQ
jgi:Flp pilus assembly protein TadG